MFVDFICTVPFLADKGCPQNEYEQNEYVCCWLCYKFFFVFRFINKTTRYFLFKRNHRKTFAFKEKAFRRFRFLFSWATTLPGFSSSCRPKN